MLPTEILDNRTNKQTIRASASVRVQAAFLARINAFLKAQPPVSLNLGADDRYVNLNRLEVQMLAMAPIIEVGQAGGITDEEADRLAEYLLKAFLGYYEAYEAAKFPDPSKAALAAMQRFSLSF